MTNKNNRKFTVFAVTVALSLAGILLTGCSASSSNESKATDSSTQTATVKYTCSMHPEVVQDKPGDCPKCGMKLVQKR